MAKKSIKRLGRELKSSANRFEHKLDRLVSLYGKVRGQRALPVKYADKLKTARRAYFILDQAAMGVRTLEGSLGFSSATKDVGEGLRKLAEAKDLGEGKKSVDTSFDIVDRELEELSKYSQELRQYGLSDEAKKVDEAIKLGRKRLNELESPGLTGRIKRLLGRGRKSRGPVYLILLSLVLVYFLKNVEITGGVVTNLSSINSSFLINFILIGILGLVCYSYLN